MKKINLDEIIDNGGGVSLSPFDIKVFWGAFNVLKNTDEGAFVSSQIFPANGWEFSPEARAEVVESLRKIDAAGLLVIPEFHKGNEYDEVPYDEVPYDEPLKMKATAYAARKRAKDKRISINHFKPHVDLTKPTIKCEYVNRPFSTYGEQMAVLAEAEYDLDSTREFLYEWFNENGVADSYGELPSDIDEAMTALASIHHVLAKMTWGKVYGMAHTERDHVTIAKNHLLTALGELEKTDAYDDEDTRIPGIVRTLESAEDGLADVLKDYELGNIEEAPIDDGDNLSWVVFAETRDAEHCGKFGTFETKSAAEKYAAALDADTNHEFSVTVEKITQ